MTRGNETTTPLIFVFDGEDPCGVRFGDVFWAMNQKHRGRLPEPPPWAGYYDALPKKLSLRLFDLWFLASRRLRPGGPYGVLVAELVMLPSWNTHKAKGDPEQNAVAWIRNKGSDSVCLTDCELGPLVAPEFDVDRVRVEPDGAEVAYARGLAIAMGRAVEATRDPWLRESPDWPRLYGAADLRMVPDFTGRERELTLLRERLLTASAPTPPPVVVCGPSGIGKTQLVAAFLAHHAARFEHILVVHGSGADLTASIGRWASLLDGGTPTVRTPLQSAERVREVLERAKPSLLVLDDVTDERAATAWLPRRGPCRVLMTSQLPIVDGARPIQLAPLRPDEAAELLTWHLAPEVGGDDGERSAVQAVCDYFGGSPFALHVAGVHMGRLGLRPQELLEKIGDRGPTVISESGTDVAGYSRNLAEVFALPFTQLDGEMLAPRVLGASLPRVVAWVCGLLAPAPAPRSLVVATVLGLSAGSVSSSAIDEAIGALERRSLVRGDHREVDVHALPGRFFAGDIPAAHREEIVDAYLVELAALTRRHPGESALLPHVSRARELATSLPFRERRHPVEAELLTWEGDLVMQLHGYAANEGAPVLARAAHIAPRMVFAPDRFALQFMRWVPALIKARLDDAHVLATELVTLAASLGIPPLEAAAAQALGAVLSFQGRHAQAIATLERGVALADAAPTARSASRQAQDPRVTCRCDLARSYLMIGRPDSALALIHEASELGREHPFSHAFAMFNKTMAHQYRREPQAANEAAQELLAMCARFGFRQFDMMGRIFLGWSIASLGFYEAGVEVCEMAMARVATLNARISRVADTTLLAELHLQAGALDEARAALARASELFQATGEVYFAPEHFRLRALVLAHGRTDEVPEAEERLIEGLAVARDQGARWHEVRLLTTLARLRRRRGDLSTASVLADCIGAITEGADLPTMREARAELEAHGASS